MLDEDGTAIPGLLVCGEMLGGLFSNYPGGSGLAAGAVFGRRAGSIVHALRRSRPAQGDHRSTAAGTSQGRGGIA